MPAICAQNLPGTSAINFNFAPISAGRPRDSFSDPVQRVRGWFWLEDVKKKAGLSSNGSLDSSRLTQGLLPAQRFRGVEEDGTNPGHVVARRKTSLVDHVATHRGYSFSRENYASSLWRLLSERISVHPKGAAWVAREWERRKIVLLCPADINRAHVIGLQWPETRVGDPEFDELPQYPHAPLDSKDFATLDGLSLLLVEYRAAQDRLDIELANVLAAALEKATFLVGRRFAEGSEARHTWEVVFKTRALTWHPRFEPNQAEVTRELLLLEQEFQNETRTPRRGRAAVGPGQSKGGKVARRWRRRAWVRAARAALSKPREEQVVTADDIRILRDANQFTSWLVANGELIDLHEAHAMREILGDDPFDDDAARPQPGDRPPPLNIPQDKRHGRARPKVDPFWEDQFGKIPYDIIFDRD